MNTNNNYASYDPQQYAQFLQQISQYYHMYQQQQQPSLQPIQHVNPLPNNQDRENLNYTAATTPNLHSEVQNQKEKSAPIILSTQKPILSPKPNNKPKFDVKEILKARIASKSIKARPASFDPESLYEQQGMVKSAQSTKYIPSRQSKASSKSKGSKKNAHSTAIPVKAAKSDSSETVSKVERKPVKVTEFQNKGDININATGFLKFLGANDSINIKMNESLINRKNDNELLLQTGESQFNMLVRYDVNNQNEIWQIVLTRKVKDK